MVKFSIVHAHEVVRKKRFSDHVKVTLKKYHIPVDQLETLADRTTWRSICRDGLDSYMSEFNQAADDRRMCRHANSTTSPGKWSMLSHLQ